MPTLRIIRLSGPGETVMSTAATRKARHCSGIRGMRTPIVEKAKEYRKPEKKKRGAGAPSLFV